MSLVMGSVDLSVTEGGGSYSGNKSLDKLYEEADGNKALSNARMTSKIDLSTDDHSCSYFIEYEGNNKRNVYCTSCLEEEDESDTNDQFCRQFVYGDEGEFDYALLDNEYVSQRRATKDTDKKLDEELTDSLGLPSCVKTIIEEDDMRDSVKSQEEICSLITSGDDSSPLIDEAGCDDSDIEQVRSTKYEMTDAEGKHSCICGDFFATEIDCLAPRCKVEGDTCIKNEEDDELNELRHVWTIYKICAAILALFIFILVATTVLRLKGFDRTKDWEKSSFKISAMCGLIFLLLMWVWRWYNWSSQYKSKFQKDIVSVQRKFDNYKFWETMVVVVFPTVYLVLMIFINIAVGWKGLSAFLDQNKIILIIIVLIFILAIINWNYEDVLTEEEKAEEKEADIENKWPLKYLL